MLTCPKQEYKKQEYKQGTIYFYGGIPQQQTQDVVWTLPGKRNKKRS